MPNMRLVLQDVDELLAAVRAFRAATETAYARILYVQLPAQMHMKGTTGVRSSWAHAAVNAYVSRAAASEPSLRLELLDALAYTWPREDASPDGIHYLRRTFTNPKWNILGWLAPASAARRERALDHHTPPPKGADVVCLGDPGWEVAMALHARMCSSEDAMERARL
jgi:hypothetical protein